MASTHLGGGRDVIACTGWSVAGRTRTITLTKSSDFPHSPERPAGNREIHARHTHHATEDARPWNSLSCYMLVPSGGGSERDQTVDVLNASALLVRRQRTKAIRRTANRSGMPGGSSESLPVGSTWCDCTCEKGPYHCTGTSLFPSPGLALSSNSNTRRLCRCGHPWHRELVQYLRQA